MVWQVDSIWKHFQVDLDCWGQNWTITKRSGKLEISTNFVKLYEISCMRLKLWNFKLEEHETDESMASNNWDVQDGVAFINFCSEWVRRPVSQALWICERSSTDRIPVNVLWWHFALRRRLCFSLSIKFSNTHRDLSSKARPREMPGATRPVFPCLQWKLILVKIQNSNANRLHQ